MRRSIVVCVLLASWLGLSACGNQAVGQIIYYEGIGRYEFFEEPSQEFRVLFGIDLSAPDLDPESDNLGDFALDSVLMTLEDGSTSNQGTLQQINAGGDFFQELDFSFGDSLPPELEFSFEFQQAGTRDPTIARPLDLESYSRGSVFRFSDFSSGEITEVTWRAVPEPGSATLLIGLGIAAAMRRRRSSRV